MAIPGSRITSIFIASIMALTVQAVAMPSAWADRCQPEELVSGPGPEGGASFMPEDASPFCLYMDGVVYPLVNCNNSTANDTLMECVNQMTGDPFNTSQALVTNSGQVPSDLVTSTGQAPQTLTSLLAWLGTAATAPEATFAPFYCATLYNRLGHGTYYPSREERVEFRLLCLENR